MFISLDTAYRTYGKENVNSLIKDKKLKVITKTLTTQASGKKNVAQGRLLLSTGPSITIDYVDIKELATLLDKAGKL